MYTCRRDHIIQRPIGSSDFKRRGSVGLIIMQDLLLKIDKGQSVILIFNVLQNLKKEILFLINERERKKNRLVANIDVITYA